MTSTTLHVSGMTCDHCVRAVTEEIAAIDGVDAVDVDLVAGGASSVVVHSTRPVSAAEFAAAVDEAGYELADD
jgi:copper ion binding protein